MTDIEHARYRLNETVILFTFCTLPLRCNSEVEFQKHRRPVITVSVIGLYCQKTNTGLKKAFSTALRKSHDRHIPLRCQERGASAPHVGYPLRTVVVHRCDTNHNHTERHRCLSMLHALYFVTNRLQVMIIDANLPPSSERRLQKELLEDMLSEFHTRSRFVCGLWLTACPSG